MSRKLVVLVDQDGPLADFDRKFFADCELNGWPMDCTLETQRHRFATDHIPDVTHRAAARKMVDTTRWFRDLPVVEGAVDGIHKLAQIADVWICTKPLEANRYCRDDKAAWVEEHLGRHWLDRLIIAPDKGRVWGDILLDDAPKAEWFGYATWEPVIYPTPWNGPENAFDTLRRWDWTQDPQKLVDGWFGGPWI